MKPEYEQSKIVKKRNKPSLVCSNCRRKKTKCDRALPCNTCVKAKCVETCHYDPVKSTSNNSKTSGKKSNDSARHSNPYQNEDQNQYNVDNVAMATRPTSAAPPLTNGAMYHHHNGYETMPSGMLGIQIGGQVGGQMSGPMGGQIQTPIHQMGGPGSTGPTGHNAPPPVANYQHKFFPMRGNEPRNLPGGHSESSASLSGSSAMSGPPTVNINHGGTYDDPLEALLLPIEPPLEALAALSSADPTYGINPYNSQDETFNFYEGYSPYLTKQGGDRVNLGPLCWGTFLKKDPYFLIFCTKAQLSVEAERNLCLPLAQTVNKETLEALKVDANDAEVEKTFRKKALVGDGLDELAPINLKVSSKFVTGGANVLDQSGSFFCRTLFEGREGQGEQFELLTQIRNLLPRRKVIWLLLDRFFSDLYQLMPIIDETDFRSQMIRLLGEPAYLDDHVEELKLDKKLDLAYISSLLVILRVTYLSLFDNRNKVNEDNLNTLSTTPEALNLKYLLQNPINVVCIELARQCLDKFTIANRASFAVLQAYMVMRIYSIHAPEEGDGFDGGDSKVSMGRLVQMSYAMGLNREPDNFDETKDSHIRNQLGRKIWHWLVRENYATCMTLGNPPLISPGYFDTKVPYHLPGKNETSTRVDMELSVVHMFRWFNKHKEHMHYIMNMIHDVKGRIPMPELLRLITHHERLIPDRGDLAKAFPGFPFTPLMKRNLETYGIRVHFNLKSNVLAMCYHLFLYYERIGASDIAHFYQKKLCCITLFHILPQIFEIVCGKEASQGIHLNHLMLQIIQRANQVTIGMMLRIATYAYFMQHDSKHNSKMAMDPLYAETYDKVILCFELYKRSCELQIQIVSGFTSRYYYAWRTFKAQTFLIKHLGNIEICGQVGYRGHFHINLPQLREMVPILKSTVSTLKKVSKYKENNNHEEIPELKIPPVTTSPSSEAGSDSGMASGSSNHGDSVYDDYASNLQADIDQMWIQMFQMKSNPADNVDIDIINDFNGNQQTPIQYPPSSNNQQNLRSLDLDGLIANQLLYDYVL